MKKVVITGPESSGKSTLSKHLSESLFTPHAREYAREYIASLDRAYTKDDLTQIAKGQMHLEEDILCQTPSYLICDTDLLTIKIWSEYKFGSCDLEIINLLMANLPDLYLLASPDFPWEDDSQRESPDNRDRLFSIYKAEIIKLGIPYVILSGSESKRLERAMEIFSNYFN
jgi:NadR type nicotinamide-nucleotide adenylyltransferase|tara:strand:- start:28 stop:540 length:513 start_codon:yes stop_codon:yes gene_type:complete